MAGESKNRGATGRTVSLQNVLYFWCCRLPEAVSVLQSICVILLLRLWNFPLRSGKLRQRIPHPKKNKIKKELSIYRLLPDLEENGGWKVPCSLNPKRYLQETKQRGGYDVLRGDCHPELWLRQRTQGISTKGRAALSHCTGQS